MLKLYGAMFWREFILIIEILFCIYFFSAISASLTDVRQALAAPKHQNQEKNQSLAELRSNIHAAIVGHVKSALNNLKVSETNVEMWIPKCIPLGTCFFLEMA